MSLNLYVNSAFFPKLKAMLEGASTSIDIIIYNWHFYVNDLTCNTSQINQIITQKIKQGINVRVVVGNITLYHRLKKLGADVRYNKLRGLNHAKLVLVDNKFCSVGSHNFSENAWSRNEEASVLSNDEQFIMQAKKYFNVLYNSCK